MALHQEEWNRHEIGDCLEVMRSMPDCVVDTCVTSPPYWGLRDYGCDGQIGHEETHSEYIDRMVLVFREVRRILKDSGTLWLNLGDTYASATKGKTKKPICPIQKRNDGSFFTKKRFKLGSLKRKDLAGIPWRVALALQDDGWYLRSDIIWFKPNAMPDPAADRPSNCHEHIFLLSKTPRYYYDAGSIKERVNNPEEGRPQTRTKRSVWPVNSVGFKGDHFATFPPKLIAPCIVAGAPMGGLVFDPFLGSGTTGMVAESLGRKWFGVELNQKYEHIIRGRTAQRGLF